jgi:hypothetical protein
MLCDKGIQSPAMWVNIEYATPVCEGSQCIWVRYVRNTHLLSDKGYVRRFPQVNHWGRHRFRRHLFYHKAYDPGAPAEFSLLHSARIASRPTITRPPGVVRSSDTEMLRILEYRQQIQR